MPKNTGDGTSDLLNKGAQAVAVIGYLAAAYGCSYWMRALGQPRYRGGILLSLLLLFLVTLVHELGHASIGLALHMRLRAFLAGPFEFRMREGRWTFRFNLAGIVGAGGATGVVPSIPRPPRWHSLLMIAAGPATNLYTGLIALAFAWACSVSGGDNLDYVYPLGRFAAFSFVACIFNMIPMRSGNGYSDGAQIYQLLSGGAWADYHNVIALVGSSLVTPLQPRDYDIEAIQRASQTISKGQMGLLLRLYAYSHYVDSGQFSEADQALAHAEAVYKDSASGITADLHTVFVFGNAVVRRDAAATRLWWDRMIAKKPTRLNCDYWRAQAALLWIEGNLSKANESWATANAMAKLLPSAGAYEYDRTCCNLLRQAMDGQPLDTKAPPPKAAPVVAAPVVAQAPTVQWHFLNPGKPLGPSPSAGSD
jgi:glutathione S-transferase